MKKIICPTDFSDAAQNAVAYAAQLAHDTHCELKLFHVQSLYDLTPAEVWQEKSVALAGVADQLAEGCRQISKTFKVPCSAEVKVGATSPSSIIGKAAHDYDLIVMGTNGAENIYQYFTGSTTYHTIQKADTPLLVVPDDCYYRRMKRIVYAFNYMQERELPLINFIPIVKLLAAELTVLQVVKDPCDFTADSERNNFETLLTTFYKEDLELRYDTVYGKNVALDIHQYVTNNRYDALALCSTNHALVKQLFHRSVIKKISAFCYYPLFVFPNGLN